jgi:hypothetical protein
MRCEPLFVVAGFAAVTLILLFRILLWNGSLIVRRQGRGRSLRPLQAFEPVCYLTNGDSDVGVHRHRAGNLLRVRTQGKAGPVLSANLR